MRLEHAATASMREQEVTEIKGATLEDFNRLSLFKRDIH